MKKYLTTAIFYANGPLHIGNLYEIVYADALNKYFKMCDESHFFQTGMDDHGQKIFEKAAELKITPQELVDKNAANAKNLFSELDVEYDNFIRTTNENHKRVVQEIFEKLYQNGDIYLGEYEGHYCVFCEAFHLESQLVEGKCPTCDRKVEVLKEESYFLNLKKYETQLLNHIKANEHFITPKTRRNEIIAFLENGLEDLSVTRTSFDWGIQVPFDKKHVIYVWLDALTNYISGAGYLSDEDRFMKTWNESEVVHIIGKDITRFHAIYWPIILMALDLKLPDKIVVHGFMTLDNMKMSKSLGNTAYLEDYSKYFSIDPVRYYLLSELANGRDGNISVSAFIDRYNYELVNDLSNLVNRTISMANKYFTKPLTISGVENEFDRNLVALQQEIIKKYHQALQNFDTKTALQEVFTFIRASNKYIDETMPWKLNDNKDAQQRIIYYLLEALRITAIMLKPFISKTAKEILKQINQLDVNSFEEAHFIFDKTYTDMEANIIFKRAKKEEIMEEKETVNLISFDDFCKIEMKVAKVISCEKHPKADRLLVFKVDDGNKVRQIVSGIAEFYEPSTLIGKNVVIVANLEPIKLRSVLSEGMILSAELDSKLAVVESCLDKGANVK